MRLCQRTHIDRPAADVWPYVIRPEHFQKWNTKIRSMDATGTFQLGQPFTTHYEWKGKAVQCVSRATDIQDGRVLELRHSGLAGPGIRPDMHVTERVTLKEFAGRTTVTKVVTITNHGIPWFVMPLLWFVSQFGKPVGPDPLKSLCEAGRGAE